MSDLRTKPVENLFRVKFLNHVGDIDSEVIERIETQTVTLFDMTDTKKFIVEIADITPLRVGDGWKITDCVYKAQSILKLFDEHFSFSMHKDLEVAEDDQQFFEAVNILDSVIDQLNVAKEELKMHLSYTDIKGE